MPLETIKFGRVFGMTRRTVNFQVVTQFGFESDTTKQHAVTVPGRPSIEDGMTVTAFLKSEGRWNYLAGWYNHSNGEIVVETVAPQALFALASVFSLARFWPWFATHLIATVCAVMVLLGLCALLVRRFIFARHVRAELRRVRDGAMPARVGDFARGEREE
jgi:hypothetical protein